MATTINYTTVRTPQRTTGVPRPCPACGGLECLCRPRFFAGQLLTEEDLNRLDHYIVAKQKLHNRYLHGWGVVCGLDVVCDACGEGSVIVRSGYALSPCGEDVIVCNDARVPVCDLISDCRETPDPDCLAPTIDRGCDEPVQQWILAICYNETPSRGVAPLKSSCGCGCGCGGGSCGCSGGRARAPAGCGCGGGGHVSTSGDCGCGCGGAKKNGNGHSTATKGCGCGSSQKGTVATTSASRGASLIQCENTVVCEGYCFRVYKAPRNSDKRQKLGAMPQAFLDCVAEFTDAMPTFSPTTTNQQELHDWCCDMHDAWADWFLAHPPYNCELPQRIALIPCPNVGDPNFNSAIDSAKSQFLLGGLEILISCFCSAIMPPCPDFPADDCVPLAVVTVRTDDGCHVQSICNWTTYRKYVTTFPSLQYWLSVFPFGRLLREAIEGICCKPFGLRGFVRETIDMDANREREPASGGARARRRESAAEASEQPSARTTTSAREMSPSSFFRPSAQTLARSRAFMTMAMAALTSDKRSANAEELVLGILGEKNEKGEKYLSEMESENLMQYLVLDQMAKPTLRNLFGEKEGGAGAIFRAVMGGMAGAGSAETDTGLAAEVDELRATVERQSRQIEELLRARRGRNK